MNLWEDLFSRINVLDKLLKVIRKDYYEQFSDEAYIIGTGNKVNVVNT